MDYSEDESRLRWYAVGGNFHLFLGILEKGCEQRPAAGEPFYATFKTRRICYQHRPVRGPVQDSNCPCLNFPTLYFLADFVDRFRLFSLRDFSAKFRQPNSGYESAKSGQNEANWRGI